MLSVHRYWNIPATPRTELSSSAPPTTYTGLHRHHYQRLQVQWSVESASEQTDVHTKGLVCWHPVFLVWRRPLGPFLVEAGFMTSGKSAWLLWVSVFASTKWQAWRESHVCISSNVSHTSLPSLPWFLPFALFLMHIFSWGTNLTLHLMSYLQRWPIPWWPYLTWLKSWFNSSEIYWASLGTGGDATTLCGPGAVKTLLIWTVVYTPAHLELPHSCGNEAYVMRMCSLFLGLGKSVCRQKGILM